MPDASDEFYVGYLKTAPDGLGRSTKNGFCFSDVLYWASLCSIASRQKNFWPGTFEYGNNRSFEGILLERPYPTLLVERPNDAQDAFPFSRYLLVNPFKFGAEKSFKGLNGQRVNFDGQLIYQDGTTMIEVVPDSIERADDATDAVSLPSQELGTHTLRGEIVDSKCYLGVMNPGNLKTHKACAIRCISGGIPPVFLVRKEDGAAVYLLMVNDAGETVNEEVLSMVADPLEIEGKVRLEGGMLILYANPDTYIRLEEIE